MRWIIPVSELARLAKVLRKDGMDYVEFEFDEGSPFPSVDPLPPCVNFYGFKKSDPGIAVDYEEIEVLTGLDDLGSKGGRSRF